MGRPSWPRTRGSTPGSRRPSSCPRGPLGFGATNSAVTIDDVSLTGEAPLVDAGADRTVDEGSTFSSAGSFIDPDAGDTWTATVNYGDGTGLQPLILTGTTFQLSHVYAD